MEISKVNSDLHSILLSVKERTKIETRVATVCKITKVDETNKRLNAKPIIKEKYITKTGETEYVDLPELLNIPYLSILGVPIVNEYCVIIHLDRSLNGVDLSKEPTTVESIGNIHNISDGIALFGFKETAVNPENITKRLDDLDKTVVGLNKKIDIKQNKLTFDTIPTFGSNNPVTSNGIAQYSNRRHKLAIYTNQPASKQTLDYSVSYDTTWGVPTGILFEHYTHYDDYVCTFFPIIQMINVTTLLIGYRDCYINFKDMNISFDGTTFTFRATLKGQDGFKENTQGAYIIW